MGCHQAKASDPNALNGPSTLLGRVGLRSTKDEKEEQNGTRKLRRPRTRECEEAEMTILTRSVGEQLPEGPRICILGSTAFWNEGTEPLVKALARRLSSSLRDSNAVILTGGNPGVQEVLAKGLQTNNFRRVWNLVHLGHESGFAAGEDLAAGLDAAERRKVLGRIGDVYLCIEGGPGVSEEAKVAYDNGAFVLPVPSTGGACGGAFNFPQAALERPRHASAEEWAQLSSSERHPDEVAAAIVRILCRHLEAEAKMSGQLLKGAVPDADAIVAVQGHAIVSC